MVKQGAEFTAYQLADAERVQRVLERHRGTANAATEVDLAREAGMPERKFRAILADFDGIPGRWLVGKVNRSKDTPGGIFLADDPEDAASLTAELRAKQETLDNRLGRRARWCGQRVTQLGLFERGAA